MYKKIIFGIIFFSFFITGFSQNPPCSKHITGAYLADPQFHFTYLSYNETKEFNITFIGGNTYRIAVASAHENNIAFSIIDQENNELFSNIDFNNAAYWDFEIPNTMECRIKISLISELEDEDFGAICIGYKQ